MKQLMDKFIAYGTFTVVFFLHIYFALLLCTQTALAEETAAPVPAPVKVEKVQKVEKAAKAPVASKMELTDVTPPQPPKPPKPSKMKLDDDIKINFDMKNGVTVKGLNKVIEKAEKMDRRRQHDDDEDATDNDEGDDDDSGSNSRHIYVNNRINDFPGKSAAVAVPIGFFILVILYFKHKSRREYMETVRLLVEKGQPIPPDLLNSLNPSGLERMTSSPQWEGYQSHLIKGLKPMFWGIGIFLFFVFEHFDAVPWFFGVAFILIGAYHVVRSHLIQKEKEKNPTPPVAPAVEKK
jgi:hypothetical protein